MRKGNGKTTLWSEFKKFISQGNVINLAVAVVIGAAFTAIVNSFVKDLIMPVINAIFALVGAQGGVEGLSVQLNAATVSKYLADGSINPDAIFFNYGNFLQAIINFLIIAAALFFLIRALRKAGEFGLKAKKDLKGIIFGAEKPDSANAENAKAGDTTKIAAAKDAVSKDEAKTEVKAETVSAPSASIEASDTESSQTDALLREIRDLLKAQSKAQSGN